MKFTKNDQQLLAEAYTEVSLRELTIVEEKAIDKIQTALDIVGLEPTFGSIADGTIDLKDEAKSCVQMFKVIH